MNIELTDNDIELKVPLEFMTPGEYEFEVLAIEISGNSIISVGEFEISIDD